MEWHHTRLATKENTSWVSIFPITFAHGLAAYFSPSMMKWSLKMFIKSPTREASWTTYVQPFDITLWFALLLLLIFMMLCLSATYMFGPEKYLNPDSFSLINSFILIWGSQIGQKFCIKKNLLYQFPLMCISCCKLLCCINVIPNYWG